MTEFDRQIERRSNELIKEYGSVISSLPETSEDLPRANLSFLITQIARIDCRIQNLQVRFDSYVNMTGGR